MKRTIFLASLLCLGLASPASASESKDVSLAPTTPWNIDFGEHTCRLARVFGDEGNRHLLFFEQTWPGRNFGLTAAGPSFEEFGNREPTRLHFSSHAPAQDTSPFKGNVVDIGPALIFSRARLEPFEDDDREGVAFARQQLAGPAAKSAEHVSFEQEGQTVRFETGELDGAFAALDTCARDLVKSWGLDLERHMTARSMAKWPNREKIEKRIGRLYPTSALRLGEQAIVRMRVMVDENGKVTDCHIVEATDTERLKSPACQQMKRAKFDPAIDAQGQPFPSYHAVSITYRIKE